MLKSKLTGLSKDDADKESSSLKSSRKAESFTKIWTDYEVANLVT